MAQTSNGKTEIAKTQAQKTLDNGLVNQKTAKENYAEAKKVNNEAIRGKIRQKRNMKQQRRKNYGLSHRLKKQSTEQKKQKKRHRSI